MVDVNSSIPEYKSPSSSGGLAEQWNKLSPRTKGIVLAAGGGLVIGIVVLLTRNKNDSPSKDLTGYEIVDENNKKDRDLPEGSPFDDGRILDAIDRINDRIDRIGSGNSGGNNSVINYGSDYGIGPGSTLSYFASPTVSASTTFQGVSGSTDYVSPSTRLDNYDFQPANSIVTDNVTGRMSVAGISSLRGEQRTDTLRSFVQENQAKSQANTGRPQETQSVNLTKTGNNISYNPSQRKPEIPKVKVNPGGRTTVEQN